MDFNVGDTVDSIARMLAASGWTTIGVHAPLGSGEQWVDDAARTSIGRVAEPRAREALYTSERGNDPLIAFAVETGGTVGTPGMIGKSVQRLEQALIISYQVSRQPDGKPRSIEIKSRRPGLEVRGFKWATESTPNDLAATRTLSLLSRRRCRVAICRRPFPRLTGRIGPRREGRSPSTRRSRTSRRCSRIGRPSSASRSSSDARTCRRPSFIAQSRRRA
jgi:hypothetical protein